MSGVLGVLFERLGRRFEEGEVMEGGKGGKRWEGGKG